MPGPERIEFSEEANLDLQAIGGSTEEDLIREIFLLPDVPESKCRKLPFDEPGLERWRWEIGRYSVLFHYETRFEGPLTVIERVVTAAALDALVKARSVEVEFESD
jgi:hypothetical protein